jgi:hypothetical protein
MRTFTAPAALLGAALIVGCIAQPQTAQSQYAANPYPPVPPLVLEVIPKPPVSGQQLLWQPGHWDWTGGGYVWAGGEYVPAAGHGNLWMPVWWARTDAGWTWQPAHWTS